MPFGLYSKVLKTEKILQFWNKKFSSFQCKRLISRILRLHAGKNERVWRLVFERRCRGRRNTPCECLSYVEARSLAIDRHPLRVFFLSTLLFFFSSSWLQATRTGDNTQLPTWDVRSFVSHCGPLTPSWQQPRPSIPMNSPRRGIVERTSSNALDRLISGGCGEVAQSFSQCWESSEDSFGRGLFENIIASKFLWFVAKTNSG